MNTQKKKCREEANQKACVMTRHNENISILMYIGWQDILKMKLCQRKIRVNIKLKPNSMHFYLKLNPTKFNRV